MNNITQETLDQLANSINCKISLVQMYKREGVLPSNKRDLCFYSEWKGIEDAMRILGIEFTYDFNEDVTEITATIIEGNRYEL